MSVKKDHIVFFVEGETEKEFYDALIKFYASKSSSKLSSHKIYNVKGISRFEHKVTSKLKHEIIPKYSDTNLKVICCYDNDVFELARKPPTNWQIVKKKVNDLGIKDFFEVKAQKMIEDWLLKDIDGLCRYLNIEIPKKLEGKNGLDKMKNLFKRGPKPKVYQKGAYVHKFIPFLNFEQIRSKIKEDLNTIEVELKVVIKEPKVSKKASLDYPRK